MRLAIANTDRSTNLNPTTRNKFMLCNQPPTPSNYLDTDEQIHPQLSASALNLKEFNRLYLLLDLMTTELEELIDLAVEHTTGWNTISIATEQLDWHEDVSEVIAAMDRATALAERSILDSQSIRSGITQITDYN